MISMSPRSSFSTMNQSLSLDFMSLWSQFVSCQMIELWSQHTTESRKNNTILSILTKRRKWRGKQSKLQFRTLIKQTSPSSHSSAVLTTSAMSSTDRAMDSPLMPRIHLSPESSGSPRLISVTCTSYSKRPWSLFPQVQSSSSKSTKRLSNGPSIARRRTWEAKSTTFKAISESKLSAMI